MSQEGEDNDGERDPIGGVACDSSRSTRKEEKAKKKEQEHDAPFLLVPKLQPEKITMIDRGCPILVSAVL